MTLQEVIDLGYKSVTAKVSGYQETDVFGCYQPFRSIRPIIFKINPEFMTLEHKTFWINDEEVLNYVIEDGEVILYEPDMYASATD